MKKITLDTRLDEIIDAVDRGDLTYEDLKRQVPRIREESAQRDRRVLQAINEVKAQDPNKKRSSRWKGRWLREARLILVECGRTSWHVNPDNGRITKIH